MEHVNSVYFSFNICILFVEISAERVKTNEDFNANIVYYLLETGFPSAEILKEMMNRSEMAHVNQV